MPNLLEGDSWGALSIHTAQSPVTNLVWAVRAHYHVDPQDLHECGEVSPRQEVSYKAEYVVPQPLLAGLEHHITWKAVACPSVGAIVRIATVSSPNSVTSNSARCVRSTAAASLRKTTESAAEYRSTPNGQVCALLTQSSTMSSSEMEEASSGVPSLFTNETTSSLSGKGSGDWTSQSRETVAEEVTDMLWEFCFTYCCCCRVDPAGSQVCTNNTIYYWTRLIACLLRWQAQLKFTMEINKLRDINN